MTTTNTRTTTLQWADIDGRRRGDPARHPDHHDDDRRRRDRVA